MVAHFDLIAEQFPTVINFAVTVSVENKESILCADPCSFFSKAVFVKIKVHTIINRGQCNSGSAQVNDQRIPRRLCNSCCTVSAAVIISGIVMQLVPVTIVSSARMTAFNFRERQITIAVFHGIVAGFALKLISKILGCMHIVKDSERFSGRYDSKTQILLICSSVGN